jgi:lysophospholipase L1-like esterase
MKNALRLALLLSVGCGPLFAQTNQDPVDFNRARQLRERQRGGAALSADENASLARAVAARNAGGRGAARPANQRPAPERLTPLTDLGATEGYEGEEGGLYGGGSNTPPAAHRRAAEEQLAQIRPLNAAGEAVADGTIGFVAISMSNATQEFSRFKQIADASPLKSARVTIVDCAQGGQAMAQWVPVDGRPWEEAKRRLAAAQVSPQQVQIAWIKLANVGPSGSLAAHGRKLERDTLAVLQQARAQFPHLRIAYLGSRTYGGYAVGGLNPEPYAFEGAFAVRWLIARQIKGDPELALAKVPLLLWGPYLWADGPRGRKLDSLVWARGDFGDDGVHPSAAGRQKVAELLLHFCTTDPLATPWFTGK